GDGRCRRAGARGPGFCAVGRAARSAHDDHPTQRRQPDRRVHVAGERSGSGGNRRQGHAAGGRDLDRLLGPDRLHRDRYRPVPHSRAFRQRRYPDARPFPRRTVMIGSGTSDVLGEVVVIAILVVPALSAALLALLPAYRLTARLNVAAAFVTFVLALT